MSCKLKHISPDFSPVCVMIAQGFDSPKDFLTEGNSSVYFRGKKILWCIKDQARARVSGEKSGLVLHPGNNYLDGVLGIKNNELGANKSWACTTKRRCNAR